MRTRGKKRANNKKTDEEEVVESNYVQETEQQSDSAQGTAQQSDQIKENESDVKHIEDQTEGDNHNSRLFVDENDDSDEAPEDVSWKLSKEVIVNEMKKQDETLHERKMREKEARRLKDEWLKQQKKDKMARQRSKLPVDILQAVAKKQQGKSNSEEKNQQKHITFDERSDSKHSEQDFCDDIDEVQDLSFASKQLGIKVSVLKKEAAQSKKISSSATEFLQQHLYGNRLHRVPTLNAFSQKRKTKRLGPAMKFVKKKT